ncbi:alpha/beta hydrolase [Micromonospora coerulea]|uniref:Alpha/beta hydrolase n=1 Tax=Micromonospora coerulea TaxID=47856 RepID=A0ABP8T5E0_9ACTN
MRPALAVLVVLALLLAIGWLMQRRLIYFPDRSAVPRAAAVLPQAHDVTLETSDRLRLGAWLVPPSAPVGPGGGYTVLVANGNAGNRSYRVPLAAALAAEGFAVLLFDYRGYGGNPGSPSEAGLARDVRAAYRHLTEFARVPPDRVVLYGESLGSAVVTELATEHPPAALVLRSPFVDLPSLARVHYPFVPAGLLLRDRYSTAAHIGRVAVPTAVVFGTGDTTVPPEQSRTVAAKAAGPVTVTAIPGADHNDRALLDGPELIAAVVQIIRGRS